MANAVDRATQTMIANFPAKTGKPLDEWVKLVKASGVSKHGEVVSLLKTQHGMGHGFANLVAHTAAGAMASDPDDLIAAQYAGPKTALRPLYDKLAAFIAELGPDVEISPKKTSVSFRRTKQFACATPATKSRIDLGLQLKGEPASTRLSVLKPGSMTSHTMKLETISDIDVELKAWLKLAYDRA